MLPAGAEISEASIVDAEAISALAIRTYIDTWGLEFEPDELAWHLDRSISVPRWREYLARDRVFWVRIDGEPIAYVQFGPGSTPAEKMIRRLFVDRRLQNRGIGTALLQRVLAEPDVAAAEAVTIDVWQDNHGARRLYERFGFRDEGTRVPFRNRSGGIDGYDFILVRRQAPAA